MDIVEIFMAQYVTMIPDLREIEQHTRTLVRTALKDAGILAITTSRVKDSERLKEKLDIRNREKHYHSIQDIIADIPDFIGIRIALYFPGDNDRVRSLIYQYFKVEKVKQFPTEQRENSIYQRKFPGYCATHYRVHLAELLEGVSENHLIEIQVASLLMHAWSEVEHDLAYKQKKGDVSYDEYESLDEINGLVLAGELSLQRLQRISELRIATEKKKFENHYQLASFIYERAISALPGEAPFLGDVEILFAFFESKDRLTIQKVENDLSQVDWSSNVPVAQQLIDMYADSNVKDSKRVIERRRKKADSTIMVNDAEVGSFLRKWVALEKKIYSLLQQRGYKIRQTGNIYQAIEEAHLLPECILGKYKELRIIRNQLVHSFDFTKPFELGEYSNAIDAVSEFLSNIT